jgi:hypothetical protein
LIAEVLSPSTMAIDFGPKSEEYKTIDTLRHYLVLAQDEPRIWLWSRAPDGGWGEPEMIEGPAETVPFPGIGLVLQLSQIYAGIVDA